MPSLASVLAAAVHVAEGMVEEPEAAAGVRWSQLAQEGVAENGIRIVAASTADLHGATQTDAGDFTTVLMAVRQGNDAAARQLVELVYPGIIRIIRSHLPPRSDEEDVAQEVFLKMFSRLGQFRGDSPFPHWVSRIATNTCLDHLRRWRARREVRFADLTAAEEALLQARVRGGEDESDIPISSLDGQKLVGKLLSSLKPDQQLVMRLLEVERQSVREVCSLTGWTSSKVKMTALRARRKLAGTLSRLGKTFVF